MPEAIDTELQRRMENWARWRTGASVGLAMSGAYSSEALSGYRETPIPLINGEACDVEEGVQRLENGPRRVVEEYWLRAGNVLTKAIRLRCTPRTFYRQLDLAHRGIDAYLVELRRRTEQRRAMLESPRGTGQKPASGPAS